MSYESKLFSDRLTEIVCKTILFCFLLFMASMFWQMYHLGPDLKVYLARMNSQEGIYHYKTDQKLEAIENDLVEVKKWMKSKNLSGL